MVFTVDYHSIPPMTIRSESMNPAPNGKTPLEEIDLRQDEVLMQLDALNAQVERAIRESQAVQLKIYEEE